jgi:hypothetical protein
MRLNLAVHTRTWATPTNFRGLYSQQAYYAAMSRSYVNRQLCQQAAMSRQSHASYVTQLCQQAAMPTGSYVTPITRQLCHAAMSTGSLTGSYVTPITRLSPLGLLCYIHYNNIYIYIYIYIYIIQPTSRQPDAPLPSHSSDLAFAWPNVRMPKKYVATKYAITTKKKYLNPLTHTLAYTYEEKKRQVDAPREFRQLSLKSKSCRQHTYRIYICACT